MKVTEKWAYSLDNEYYNSPFYDSYQEALKDGIDDANTNECDKVYVGKVMKFVPTVDADIIIEYLQEKAYEEAGDVSLDYLENIPLKDRLKLEEMLTETFNQWAKETNNEPNFYTVEETSVYEV